MPEKKIRGQTFLSFFFLFMTSEEEISVPRRTEEYERSIFEQEFTEEDVLPFLLQAQDIISKLESRVVELEKDLSVK